jgi:hypothetical protein
MKTLAEIQDEIGRLTHAEQEQLREFMENLIEDRLEFTDEFKAKLKRAEAEIAAGLGRVVKP